MPDDRLEEDETLPDRDEPVEPFGHLYACEAFLTCLWIQRGDAE
jgi:hypothetical protein